MIKIVSYNFRKKKAALAKARMLRKRGKKAGAYRKKKGYGVSSTNK